MQARSPRFNLLLALVLVPALACDKAEDKKTDDKKAEDKADDKKAEEPKADEPEAPKAPAIPELAEQDLSEKAKEFVPGFTGKLTAMVPAGAEITQGMGGFDVKTEGFGMSVMVGAYSAEEVKARVEKGEDALDEEKVVDSGEGFVLYEGKAFGEHGFHVQVDLPPMGGLKAACSTPMAQGYPEANARKIIEACKSIKIEE